MTLAADEHETPGQGEHQQPIQWQIPRNVWYILIGWGVTVLLLAGLFSLRMELNQRHNQREDEQLRRDLCGIIEVSSGGPTPAPGPAGDRARSIIPKMEALRKTVCGPGS